MHVTVNASLTQGVDMNKPAKIVELLVVGRGKLASMILRGGLSQVSCMGHPHDDVWNIQHKPREGYFIVAFHCGSGKQFPLLVEQCNLWNIPLIQAASSLKESSAPDAKLLPPIDPSTLKFPLILAPNLALPITALLKVLPVYGKMMQAIGAETVVLESHQAAKKSAPITAQNITEYYGNKRDQVVSIRDPNIQKELLGVPEEHLDGHAIHMINSTGCEVRVEIKTTIYGRGTYLKGLEMLIGKLYELDGELKPGIHQAEDLLFG